MAGPTAALIMLFGLGVIFSPQFRALILIVGGIILFALVVFVIYRALDPNRGATDVPLTNPVPRLVRRESAHQRALSSREDVVVLHPVEELRSLSDAELTEKLRDIDWFQFEKLVSAIYSNHGYTVQRSGGANPDGGVDLLLETGEGKKVVQCKHWRTWNVGVRQIREFLGTLKDTEIDKGIFVTLRGYTSDAKALADKHGIVIVNESDLTAMMRGMDGTIDPECIKILNDERKVCPKCESELVLRSATRGFNKGGRFWGCKSYPKCRYILRV